MCLISQISSIPSHRVAINLGFQTNYALPYQLPSVYSPIFWAREFSHASNPLVNFFERLSENDENEQIADDSKTELPGTTEIPESEELETTEESFTNKTDGHKNNRHKRMVSFDSDISAGQFYYGLIDVLE